MEQLPTVADHISDMLSIQTTTVPGIRNEKASKRPANIGISPRRSYIQGSQTIFSYAGAQEIWFKS